MTKPATIPWLPDVLRWKQPVAGQARTGAKVVLTGDHARLTAIESGGAMATLARKLGYAQLTAAMRFLHGRERGASMALRAGYAPVPGLCDEQGRITGPGRPGMTRAGLASASLVRRFIPEVEA